jgi:hypothetical protein
MFYRHISLFIGGLNALHHSSTNTRNHANSRLERPHRDQTWPRGAAIRRIACQGGEGECLARGDHGDAEERVEGASAVCQYLVDVGLQNRVDRCVWKGRGDDRRERNLPSSDEDRRKYPFRRVSLTLSQQQAMTTTLYLSQFLDITPGQEDTVRLRRAVGLPAIDASGNRLPDPELRASLTVAPRRPQ